MTQESSFQSQRCVKVLKYCEMMDWTAAEKKGKEMGYIPISIHTHTQYKYNIHTCACVCIHTQKKNGCNILPFKQQLNCILKTCLVCGGVAVTGCCWLFVYRPVASFHWLSPAPRSPPAPHSLSASYLNTRDVRMPPRCRRVRDVCLFDFLPVSVRWYPVSEGGGGSERP